MTACSSQDDAGRPHGIAVMLSTNTQRIIQITDPTTGEVLDTKYFSLGEKQQTLANPGMHQAQAVFSAFSADYNQLAIRQKFGSGWHVGVLDATDDPAKVSKFTDLSGDTDAITAPVKQSTGAFGPDGKLYAIEQSQAGTGIRVIDVGSGKSELLNKQLDWQEHDEAGNPITVNATHDTTPYFLPHGKNLEVAPGPNKVYSPDGDWGFWAPDSDAVTRGDLQNTGDSKQATASISSYGITMFEPVVYIDRSHFIGYGNDLYYATFGRENIVLKQLQLGKSAGNPIPGPDNSSLGFTQRTEGGKYSLHVAKVDGTSATKISDLTVRHGSDTYDVSLLGWN